MTWSLAPRLWSKSTGPQHSSMQPLRCDLHPLFSEHRGGTDWLRNDPNRTRRTQEVPFIAGCSHFTRKNTLFRAPASSPKPAPCNIHAAITMRFAAPHTHPGSHYNVICIHLLQNTQEEPIDLETIQAAPAAPFIAGCSHFTRKKRIVSCSGFLPKNKPHATLTQPLQCVLQHHVHIHAVITMRFVSTRCRTQKRRNRLASKRSKPHPPHTGGTLHRRLQPLYTDKHTVSRSGFLPKTSPMQHSCSHYNAICIQS